MRKINRRQSEFDVVFIFQDAIGQTRQAEDAHIARACLAGENFHKGRIEGQRKRRAVEGIGDQALRILDIRQELSDIGAKLKFTAAYYLMKRS